MLHETPNVYEFKTFIPLYMIMNEMLILDHSKITYVHIFCDFFVPPTYFRTIFVYIFINLTKPVVIFWINWWQNMLI